jgi:hypothetical protein
MAALTAAPFCALLGGLVHLRDQLGCTKKTLVKISLFMELLPVGHHGLDLGDPVSGLFARVPEHLLTPELAQLHHEPARLDHLSREVDAAGLLQGHALDLAPLGDLVRGDHLGRSPHRGLCLRYLG